MWSLQLPLLVAALAVRLVSAQTATTVLAELNALTLIVPVASVASCNPFLTAFGACPQAATTITTCVCTPAFVAALTTCTTSMTQQLTLQGNAQAALPARSIADVTAVCAALGVVAPVGVTSVLPIGITTTARVRTTPVAVAGATVTPVPSAISFPTALATLAPGATVSAITTSDAGGAFPSVVYSTVIYQQDPFPVQTKSATVFAAGSQVKVGAWLGAVGVVVAML